MAEHPVPGLQAKWSDQQGPLVLQTFPRMFFEHAAMSPEKIVELCLESAALVEPSSGERVVFLVPLASMEVSVVATIDGRLPEGPGDLPAIHMLLFLAPLDTSQEIASKIATIAADKLDLVKRGSEFLLSDACLQVTRLFRPGEDAVAGSAGSRGGVEANGTGETTSDVPASTDAKIVMAALQGLKHEMLDRMIYACPACGTAVYPDEMACTGCKFILRSFCKRCEGPIRADARFCTKCGFKNEKHLGGVVFKLLDVAARGDVDFDTESSKLAGEIASLRTKLASDTLALGKQSLPAKKGDPATFDLASQSLALNLDELPVDEAHLLIQSMEVVPGTVDSQPSRPLLPHWDCRAIVASSSWEQPVHVGLKGQGRDVVAIPGTLFFLELQVVFVSFIEAFAGHESIFSYFNGSLYHLAGHEFSRVGDNNSMTFHSHGHYQKRFPDVKKVTLHFSWSPRSEAGSVENQALATEGLLQRLRNAMDGQSVARGAGAVLFTVGEPPSHPWIQGVVGELAMYQPHLLPAIKARYPSLFVARK